MINEFEYTDIEIDKLTRSIENAVSGDIFDTEVILIDKEDFESIVSSDWIFDWHKQIQLDGAQVYKLIIKNNPEIIQGLISLTDRSDHIYINLIESSNFNKGRKKIYLGIPGNLFAYACMLSFDKGYDGFVAFDAKTNLIKHYEETISATHFKGTRMFIDTISANKLVKQYFQR
jgi:hypothetical protein